MSLRNFIAGAVCSSPLGFSVCHLSLRFAPVRASRKKEGENALMKKKKKAVLLLLIEYIKSETIQKMLYCLNRGSLTLSTLQQDISQVREQLQNLIAH